MSWQHPFFDGNKRISFVLAATVLRMNSHYLGRSDEDEIFEALHKISDAEIDCDIECIEQWLKKKSKVWFKARQRSIYDYL
jgi:death-on-curing family protein